MKNRHSGWPLSRGATVATSATTVFAKTKLGVNLGSVNDFSDQQLTFVDIIKNGRGFGTPADPYGPTPVTVDSNGWPTVDFAILVFATVTDPLGRSLSVTAPSMLGTYHFSFTGTGTVSSGDCTVSNVVYTSGTNTTTADITATNSSATITVTVTGTTGGAQNVRLLRPGYANGTTQVFTTAFLNSLAPFSTIRLMDTLNTNANPVTTWAQRTLSTNPIQSGAAGMAWEYVVQLANTSGKDIWINIPEGIDFNDATSANYVTQLATLLHNTLNAGIHVYVEYSNELWNGIFPQGGDLLNEANAAVSGGTDTTLNYDAVNNQFYWANRLQAHRTVRISQLFAAVYGVNTVIRPVLVSQYAQPFFIEDMMTYVKDNFGAPNTFFYAIGGAPYFGLSTTFTSVDTLFTALNAGLAATTPGFTGPAYSGGVDFNPPSIKPIADYYGLKSVSYEGGPDFTGTNTTQSVIKENALSDSRLNTAVQGELSAWFHAGNDLFMYYQLAGTPESSGNIGSGFWGAYEDLAIPTQKSTALTAISNTPLGNF